MPYWLPTGMTSRPPLVLALDRHSTFLRACPVESGRGAAFCPATIANHHENPPAESLTMDRRMIYIGMILGGWVGWWAGDYVGLGIMGTLLVSTLGSSAGIYLTWRLMRDYL